VARHSLATTLCGSPVWRDPFHRSNRPGDLLFARCLGRPRWRADCCRTPSRTCRSRKRCREDADSDHDHPQPIDKNNREIRPKGRSFCTSAARPAGLGDVGRATRGGGSRAQQPIAQEAAGLEPAFRRRGRRSEQLARSMVMACLRGRPSFVALRHAVRVSGPGPACQTGRRFAGSARMGADHVRWIFENICKVMAFFFC